MSDFFNSMIQGVGGMANGTLTNMATAQNEIAQGEATMQRIQNTREQIKKMKSEGEIKVLNGNVELAGQVRI